MQKRTSLIDSLETPPDRMLVVGEKFDEEEGMLRMSIDLKRLRQMGKGSYGKKATAILLAKEIISCADNAISIAFKKEKDGHNNAGLRDNANTKDAGLPTGSGEHGVETE